MGVELAQPLFTPEGLNLSSPFDLPWRQRLSDQLLEAAWSGRIEMNPQVIHQQRQRWMIGTLVDGSQETILQMPDGQPPPASEGLHTPGAGTPAPGEQGIDIAMTPRHEPGWCQQIRQGLMRQHPPRRNTEPCSSRLDHQVGRDVLNPH